MFNCSYLLLMYKRLGLLSFDDDDRRRWLDLRTKSFKTLYLSRALCWKKNICIYCMREVCAFFGDWGKKTVRLYLWTSLSLTLFIYWFFIYVFIGFLFMSFWIFVIVFSGVAVRLVSAERGVLEIKTRREDAKRMFSKEKKNTHTNLKTVVTWDRERK